MLNRIQGWLYMLLNDLKASDFDNLLKKLKNEFVHVL
jgi:hypothetical protein